VNDIKHNIYILSGPSGVGKSTIANRLLSDKSDLKKSISYTTRKKRDMEVDGVDYHFIEKSAFEGKKANGEFIEWVEIYNNRYGTTFESLDVMMSKTDLLMVIDMVGARNIKIHYPSNSVLIYLLPPSFEELENRLLNRGCNTSKKDIEKRFSAAKEELKLLLDQSYYDYSVINNHFEDCFKEVLSIIEVSKSRSILMKDFVNSLLKDFRD